MEGNHRQLVILDWNTPRSTSRHFPFRNDVDYLLTEELFNEMMTASEFAETKQLGLRVQLSGTQSNVLSVRLAHFFESDTPFRYTEIKPGWIRKLPTDLLNEDNWRSTIESMRPVADSREQDIERSFLEQHFLHAQNNLTDDDRVELGKLLDGCDFESFWAAIGLGMGSYARDFSSKRWQASFRVPMRHASSRWAAISGLISLLQARANEVDPNDVFDMKYVFFASYTGAIATRDKRATRVIKALFPYIKIYTPEEISTAPRKAA